MERSPKLSLFARFVQFEAQIKPAVERNISREGGPIGAITPGTGHDLQTIAFATHLQLRATQGTLRSVRLKREFDQGKATATADLTRPQAQPQIAAELTVERHRIGCRNQPLKRSQPQLLDPRLDLHLGLAPATFQTQSQPALLWEHNLKGPIAQGLIELNFPPTGQTELEISWFNPNLGGIDQLNFEIQLRRGFITTAPWDPVRPLCITTQVQPRPLKTHNSDGLPTLQAGEGIEGNPDGLHGCSGSITGARLHRGRTQRNAPKAQSPVLTDPQGVAQWLGELLFKLRTHLIQQRRSQTIKREPSPSTNNGNCNATSQKPPWEGLW